VFLGAYLRHRQVPRALAFAVGALAAIFAEPGPPGSADLPIVAAGDRVAAAAEAPVDRLR
jgi:hypothetical protein